ncbi:MAG: ATP-binding cassette domain-containing protein [Polyangiales bacterium]
MLCLEARALAVAVGARTLFSNVDLHLTRGWYGLVGANGAGKSTLLRVLSGELTPTHGAARVSPADAVIARCDQRVDALDDEVRDLADRADGGASSLRASLRLDPDELARWPTLSPGERKRWQVGAALAREPDALLVDEPTNHLDAEATRWVLDALRRFRGVGVIVSHDRGVLDALPNTILRVHGGTVTAHPGRWSEVRDDLDRASVSGSPRGRSSRGRRARARGGCPTRGARTSRRSGACRRGRG